MLPREFPSREARAAALAAHFPSAAARSDAVSPIIGGRAAGLERLARIRPASYARTRNHLDGDVTGLSPYIRHGLLGLTEVRDAALARAARPACEKLLSELAWRDYYRRAFARLGTRIWDDLEPYKTGRAASAYADDLPGDLASGATGLACMDAFAAELHSTGYLHNHARMWLASYVVHHRRVRWQAGARWFLAHLLDGDPASNNLSWQWIASTFSHRPYLFNRENLERLTAGRFCATCPVRDRCPFDASYEELADRLLGGAEPDDVALSPSLRAGPDQWHGPPAISDRVLVWVHDDDLSPSSPTLATGPGSPAAYVWDPALVEARGWTLKRLMFVSESLADHPAAQHLGPAAETLAALAAGQDIDHIATTASPDPDVGAVVAALRSRGLRVTTFEPPAFVTLDRPVDLGRFSRYWRLAERRLPRG
jgi:deoxyribodipyrimidine photo-lyase